MKYMSTDVEIEPDIVNMKWGWRVGGYEKHECRKWEDLLKKKI
jgi:hypothetical protein